MADLSRRLGKVEKALNVGQEERRVVEIVMFHDGDLPPEETDGNVTVRYVSYADICRRMEQP